MVIYPEESCDTIRTSPNGQVTQELGEIRDNWMTFLKEYDLEFKPTHIVKGYGLCKPVVEVTDQSNEELEGWDNEMEMYQTKFTSAHDSSS